MKETKFRWQSLINDPKTGKRSQLMQLAKPTKDPDLAALPPFENPRQIQLGKEPITLKSAMLLQVTDSPEEVGAQLQDD